MTASVERVASVLTGRGLTLALAESCTGGLIAKMLTDGAGASAYFKAGLVTYSNRAKQDLLGVSGATLERHGAVSEETAREMAEGARRAGAADAGVAVTGIAGPSGGTPEKPVGTVWIAVAWDGRTQARRYRLDGGRAEIREHSAEAALRLLLETLGEEAR